MSTNKTLPKAPKSNAIMKEQEFATKAVVTKYHGQSNIRGSRIIARCEAAAVIVSKGGLDEEGIKEERHHSAAAKKLIDKMNWGGTWAEGVLPDGRHVFVCVDVE